MDDEIEILMRMDTGEIFPSDSVADQRVCFQEHDISSARGNLIGQSVNSRQDIL